MELRGVLDVDLVWRPVVLGLLRELPLTWITRGVLDRGWFPAPIELLPRVTSSIVVADACADPRAEVVEALRWARELLARGDVAASEVAIATTSTDSYDAYLPALAREAGLPLFSTHGLPASDSGDGRACAALADALLRGPTQERMRRLLRLVDVDGIPGDWSRRLPPGALLADAEHWRRALDAARPHRASGARAEEALPDLVALLSGGHALAAEAGERVLRGGARRLWRDALRMAPAAALELSLGGLRVADPSEPGAAISWGPAAHLAAAPRAHVRLLGLTSRDWPRSASQDPLLPGDIDDILASGQADRDLLHFDVIAGAASGGLSLSRPRRSTEGAPSPPSRLWPEQEGRSVPRGRIPLHAYGEADRLLARPADARAEPRIAVGIRCWRAWQQPALTPYDGLIEPDDPVIARTLSRILPVAALERLLRDPLAFVLLDACGLRGVEAEVASLAIEPRARGELVHEILRRTIEVMGQGSGSGEGDDETDRAVLRAADAIFAEWPVVRAVPPALPWRHAVDAAAALAREGLGRVRVAPGTTRWAEVSFGFEGAPDGGGPPGWVSADPVPLGGLRVGGRIDCLDVRADFARVTDWKTGQPPPEGVGLRGGLELQRVIYSVAAQRAIPPQGAVRALIVHLGNGLAPYGLQGTALDHCRSTLHEGLSIAAQRLREGWAMPGTMAREETYDRIRLALPADLGGWLDRKGVALEVASQPLRPLWDHT